MNGNAVHGHVETKDRRGPIQNVDILADGQLLQIQFEDGTFTFHSQWLHDAEVEDGPSKPAVHVYTQTPPEALISSAGSSGVGANTVLHVEWNDRRAAKFPALWLRVYALLVAKDQRGAVSPHIQKGWLASDLRIPEIQYSDIFPLESIGGKSYKFRARVYDLLLSDSSSGIIKVVGLPDPQLEDERAGENTLVTRTLKRLFGSVFSHPRRAADTTFNIASHHDKDAKKGEALPNYDTSKLLLPHQDLSHYEHPSRIQGLFALEGDSENTFVSCHAVLETFRSEHPELVQYLYAAPTAFGRVAHWYQPPLYQATTDALITTRPGFPDQIRRFRWHPHLSGSLITSFETYAQARIAHQKFQEIGRRDSHLLKVFFQPGDLYIWDNFRILHGREQVFTTPRTSVGQTVPEQVVADNYRDLQLSRLLPLVDEKWLIHVPQPQLNEMVHLMENWESKTS